MSTAMQSDDVNDEQRFRIPGSDGKLSDKSSKELPSSSNNLNIPNDVHFVTGRSSEGGAGRQSGMCNSSTNRKKKRSIENSQSSLVRRESGAISSGHSTSSDSSKLNCKRDGGSSSLSETDQDDTETKSIDNSSKKQLHSNGKKNKDRSTLRKGKWSVSSFCEKKTFNPYIVTYFYY